MCDNMLKEESQEEILPWKKELILSLFKRQKILRTVLAVLVLLSIVLIVRFVFVGVTLYNENKATLDWHSVPCTVNDVIIRWEAKESMYGCWDPGDPSWREDLSRDEMLPHYFTSRHYEIQYKYTFQGTNYKSNRYSIPRQYKIISRDNRKDEHFSGLDCKYEKTRHTHCFVDPKNPNQSVLVRTSLCVSDYALHMIWSFVVFVLYCLIPIYFCKKYRDNKKQITELITGQKENILEDVNRLSEPLDDKTRRYIERLADEYKIRL